MGNWRRVHIVGTCGESDVPALRQALDPGPDYENFHPLCFAAGICGLPVWARPHIDVVGNLAERDYTPEHVFRTLLELKKKAPSLDVRIHCGDDYEADNCIATVTTEGVQSPQVALIPTLTDAQLEQGLLTALANAKRL